jgi:hypothetical protein
MPGSFARGMLFDIEEIRVWEAVEKYVSEIVEASALMVHLT